MSSYTTSARIGEGNDHESQSRAILKEKSFSELRHPAGSLSPSGFPQSKAASQTVIQILREHLTLHP
jgi:hypothetical protein